MVPCSDLITGYETWLFLTHRPGFTRCGRRHEQIKILKIFSDLPAERLPKNQLFSHINTPGSHTIFYLFSDLRID
jgi:hypothetical protein